MSQVWQSKRLGGSRGRAMQIKLTETDQRVIEIAQKFEDQMKLHGGSEQNLNGFEIKLPSEDVYFLLCLCMNETVGEVHVNDFLNPHQ